MNERIQQLFVARMLKIEEEWFKKDGLDVPNIPSLDNIGILSELNLDNLRLCKIYKTNDFFDCRFIPWS